MGIDHAFLPSNLIGTWLTLRNEEFKFEDGGKFSYFKPNGETLQGDWTVSNGVIWMTWRVTGSMPVLSMRVTAFSDEVIRVESMGGKKKTQFARKVAQPTGGEAFFPASPLPAPVKTESVRKTTAADRIRAASDPPHLDNHGGPVASHPSNHVMYWSSDWDSEHSDPQFKRGNIDNWISTFLTSDYFDKAGQYGTHSGSFEGSDQSSFGGPGGTTDSALIALWVFGEIETPGTGVPYPCSSDDVYTAMLPKSTTIDNLFNKTCSSFGAYHLFGPVVVPPTAFGIGPCDTFDTGGLRFPPYTVIPVQCATKDKLSDRGANVNGFYTDFDGLTMLISHETIEAMTDPIDSFAASIPVIGGILNAFLNILDVSPAWYDDNVGNLFTDSEAADICEKRTPEVWLNNSLVAAYWSNDDNDCAAGPGVVRSFSLRQSGIPGGIPVPVTFDSRTPNVNAGGGFTIQVATNTSHSYSYPSPVNGSPGTRYVTNTPPATVNVTDTFSETALYNPQFFLNVSTNPAAAAIGNVSLTPSDWYNPGPFTVRADQDVSAGGGKRYDFSSWSGDISGNTHDLTFTLDGPKNVVANYALQDLITFDENGIPPGPQWEVTVDGTPHLGPFPDFVPEGNTVNYSYEVVVPGLVNGTCFVLTGVVPPSPLLVSAPLTVKGNYAIQTVPEAITNYKLISTQPAAGGRKFMTYQADVVNCGKPLASVTATVTTTDPFTIRVAPGQDTLMFAPVPANSQTTALNTFTLIRDPNVPLNVSKLVWTFQTAPAPPVANAGPNQSVKVGTNVLLDGTGSTNPSGIGTLTYKWMFLSRPPGTIAARIVFSTTPTAHFVADAAGTYVVQLTVSNGMQSSTTTMTVTATP